MSILKNVYKTMKEHLDSSIITKDEVGVLAGFESANSIVEEKAQQDMAELEAALVAGFEELKETSNVEVKDYQLELAKQAAVISADPIASLKNMVSNMKDPSVSLGAEALTVDPSAYADIDAVEPGFEAFDSENVKPNLHFAVITTALSAQQDEGAELFFPIIPIDANTSGATITATITSVYKDFLRGTTGATNAQKFEKTPLIKIANKPEEINVDKNRLVPVVRDNNTDKFITDLVEVVNYNGEDVKTAPIVVNRKVNILELSQTDAMLARGQMDVTDALDARVKVLDLIYSLTGKDSDGNDVTELFKFDLSAIGTQFTYSTTAHNKDIILNFETDALTVNTTTTRTATGNVSTILSNLPQGYNVSIRLVLTGTGNVQTGDIAVFPNILELVEVRDSAGAVIPTDSDDYAKIKEVFDTITAKGTTLEAYLTNTNARIRGLLLTTDRYTAVINVPFRTGYTTILPVVSDGDDGDLQALTGAIDFARLKMNAAAYQTLDTFISYLRNTGDEAIVEGVSNYFVNKFFIEENVDLSNIVDGLNSGTRTVDVREALVLKIKNAAIRAYLESNYGIAISYLMNGVKPTVIIVTDPLIGSFLYGVNGMESDGLFDYKIATSVNPLVRNKIVFSFGIFNGNRNKEPNPLNFGQCFVAPNLVIPAVKTVNNSYRAETTVMNRFLHSVNLPILCVYNVSGLETVIGKIPVNMHTV